MWLSKISETDAGPLKTSWQTRSDLEDLSKFIKVLSGNNPVHESHLLKIFLNNNKEVKTKLEEDIKSALIVQSINTFVQEKSRTRKGCYKKDDREAMMAILTACVNNFCDSEKE